MPIQVLTNDVTTRLWWADDATQQFMDVGDPPEVHAVAGLLKVWLEYRSNVFGQRVTGTCPHDPLTVAEAIMPGEFVDYSAGRVLVTEDGSTRFTSDPEGPHELGSAVDAKRFLSWLAPRLMQRL